MDYRTLLQEENDAVRERYQLSMERIKAMGTEEMRQPYGSYFKKTAAFILQVGEVVRRRWEEGGGNAGGGGQNPAGCRASGIGHTDMDLKGLKRENHALYEDILPENYGESYANPDYAVSELSDGMGQLLSFLYTEIRADIVYAFEMRLAHMTILSEVFLEVYNLFVLAWEEGREAPDKQAVKDALYWFVSDYTDLTVTWRVREGLDPGLSFAREIIMDSDLSSPVYLYQYGEYISDTELKVASFMNSLPQETIDRMADTYTEGYRKGFEVMGRDLSKKKTVVVEYQLGFERMIRKAVENFRAMGLEAVFYRAAVESVNRRPGGKRGYYGTSANRQYDYDHRYDSALYMGNGFKERRLSVLKAAYEEFKELASWCAGPALVETFGEAGFTPINKKTALALNGHQEELTVSYANESRQVVNQYMPGDETSFTIIAFPKPDIGPDFEEIFRETIRINTLDYGKYQRIQQHIIDALDQAGHVIITGRDDNETCMKVMLHPLHDRSRETNFENCVSDVNIPLGEVFTSPVLTGTEGLLHVRNVYVGDYQFKNLRMRFKDGRVTEFSCGNFEKDGSDGDGSARGEVSRDEAAQGRALVKQVIMHNHEWLPLGEFAIGTNTAAYAMARKFGIGDKLPILIAEKMGPHFAVGDTCYSFAEDSPMYNPDGKEIIARDNEISLLRKEDMSKAYFSCHTDITIPYSELGDIKAVGEDGQEVYIIRQGRFVLPGTDELNEALS